MKIYYLNVRGRQIGKQNLYSYVLSGGVWMRIHRIGKYGTVQM